MAIEVGELLARMKLDTSGMQAGVDKLSALAVADVEAVETQAVPDGRGLTALRTDVPGLGPMGRLGKQAVVDVVWCHRTPPVWAKGMLYG